MRLVETAALGQQIAEQIERHGVRRVEHQRLAKHLFGFRVAILGQECPCLAQAAEAGLGSARRGPAEAADGLVAMAERVDQGAGAEPDLGQRGENLGGTVIGHDGPADVAPLLQGNSQAEMGIGIARLAGHCPLQGGDGVGQAADLEAGQAEIVQDAGIGWLQPRRFTQGRDGIGRSRVLEQLGGRCQKRRHLWRLG